MCSKSNFRKFKKIEIIQTVFLWPQWYEIKNQQQEKSEKIYKYVETKQKLLNNHQLKEEKENKNYLKTNENETAYQILWDAAKTFLRGKL